MKKIDSKKVMLFLLELIIVSAITLALEWFYFGFNTINFHISQFYMGDGLTNLVGLKSFLSDHGFALGWPFHNDTSSYSPRYDALYQIFIHLCALFSKDLMLIQNLYSFAIPFFNVIICYLVFKYFDLSKIVSYLCAVSFGFCPYVQYRLGGHTALAAIECIPLAYLLCMWILEDPDFACFGLKWFKNKKNYLAVLFAWMIANNGMVYYPFFSCFILLVTTVCVAVKEGSIKRIQSGIISIIEIVGWLGIGFLPTIVGIFKGAGNTATDGVGRDLTRTMFYGLDIKALILSPRGYTFEKLRNVYARLPVSSNEKDYSYMGMIAVAGLFVLLIVIFIDKLHLGDRLSDRLKMLSKINVAIILLATMDGICVLVAIVFPYVSCYNRISPFVVFGSVFAFALIADAIVKSEKIKKVWKIIIYIFICACCLVAVYEQWSVYGRFLANISVTYGNQIEVEEKFFDEVDEELPPEGMVFQLPYMKSFENGPEEGIPDYDHYRGYMYIDDAKWSYGSPVGSENDVWYKETSKLDPKDMVKEVKDKGFSGIYVNTSGYKEGVGDKLVEELSEAADCEHIIRNDYGNWAYINLIE